jgi:hypothetical protein
MNSQFISDERAVAACIAIDDMLVAVAIAMLDTGRLYMLGTPWRLYIVLNGYVSVWDMRRAFEWIDSVESIAAIVPQMPYAVLFDQRVYPRGFYTLDAEQKRHH